MDLFEANRGLLHKLAQRYKNIDSAVDVDDLIQAGYIGLLEAKQTYNPEKGVWASWAWDYVRKAMREAVGLRGTRRRAHLYAISQDEPVSDMEGDVSLLDQLEDKGALEIDAHLLEDEHVSTVRAAVRKLEASRRELVIRHYFKGQTYQRIGECLDIGMPQLQRIKEQAFRDLRKDKGIQSMRPDDLDRRTRFYSYKGFAAYNIDWTSTTEAAALWRIEHERIRLAKERQSSVLGC